MFLYIDILIVHSLRAYSTHPSLSKGGAGYIRHRVGKRKYFGGGTCIPKETAKILLEAGYKALRSPDIHPITP
jgi:hypothetical protein